MELGGWADKTVESLLAANYQGILTSNLFVETQYSARKLELLDRGSRFMDQIHGTYAGSNTCNGPFDHGEVSLTRR